MSFGLVMYECKPTISEERKGLLTIVRFHDCRLCAAELPHGRNCFVVYRDNIGEIAEAAEAFHTAHRHPRLFATNALCE